MQIILRQYWGGGLCVERKFRKMLTQTSATAHGKGNSFHKAKYKKEPVLENSPKAKNKSRGEGYLKSFNYNK